MFPAEQVRFLYSCSDMLTLSFFPLLGVNVSSFSFYLRRSSLLSLPRTLDPSVYHLTPRTTTNYSQLLTEARAAQLYIVAAAEVYFTLASVRVGAPEECEASFSSSTAQGNDTKTTDWK